MAGRTHKLSWINATLQVMELYSHKAMSPQEILDEIIELELDVPPGGATPKATINKQLSGGAKGKGSVFIRISPGRYRLREKFEETLEEESEIFEDSLDSLNISSYGLHWERDNVEWRGVGGKLLGCETGGDDVDISAQSGVYLLHDGQKTVYVGKCEDSLMARLKSHTKDRLQSRWSKFSWFGLKHTREDGILVDISGNISGNCVILIMETLLIEAMEPALNRRSGDRKGVEFVQVTNPKIQKERDDVREIKKILNR